MRIIVALSVLATASVLSEVVAFALEVWRSVDTETRVLELLGFACALTFAGLLFYEHRQSRRE